MKLTLILILIAIAILLIVYIHQYKQVKLTNVYLVTGGVKTGKSLVSLWLLIMKYRSILLKYYFMNYVILNIWNYALRFIFRKKKKDRELKPMFYSNITLGNIKYNQLTTDIIRRKVRIPNKSCCFIDEASLLCDSMQFKDDLLNEEVTLFIKLFGHYSHGGYCIYNTQDLKDMHFGFKRCTSTMLWIHSRLKFPFFTIIKCRELISMNDDTIQTDNNFNEDVEESLMWFIIPNKFYYYYDCYCYSVLTDDKPYQVDYNVKKIKNKKFKKGNLKQRKITSFKTFKSFNNNYDTKES